MGNKKTLAPIDSDRLFGPTEKCFSPAIVVGILGGNIPQEQMEHMCECSACRDWVERARKVKKELLNLY